MDNLRILVDFSYNSQLIRRKLNLMQEFPSQVLFSATKMSISEWNSLYKTNFTAMARDLPDNIHLLSFKPREHNSTETILRLNHLCEVSDNTPLSKQVQISLDSLFVPNLLVLKDVKEKTLSLQQDLDQMNRQQWKPLNESLVPVFKENVDYAFEDVAAAAESKSSGIVTTLGPIQIKTFTVHF